LYACLKALAFQHVCLLASPCLLQPAWFNQLASACYSVTLQLLSSLCRPSCAILALPACFLAFLSLPPS
jgi:hypothetical protein